MFLWWNGKKNNDNSSFIHSYSSNLGLDIDECSWNSHTCDANAVCNNTRGSYTCACKLGYSGDGKNCTGKVFSLDKIDKISTTTLVHTYYQIYHKALLISILTLLTSEHKTLFVEHVQHNLCLFIIKIGPCACSDWSKRHVCRMVYCFSAHYHYVIKK